MCIKNAVLDGSVRNDVSGKSALQLLQVCISCRQADAEIVSAQASVYPFHGGIFTKPRGNLEQNAVAHVVSEDVVDNLEILDVKIGNPVLLIGILGNSILDFMEKDFLCVQSR